MVLIKERIPKSAKKVPCWIFTENGFDLVYLTDDEKYFVSVNHKKVYMLNEVPGWSMALPSDEDLFKMNLVQNEKFSLIGET